MSAYVSDVTADRFEQDVIEKSRSTVVVVDFWAPWCGPCRTLGPVLEQAVASAGGKAVLAKVNVDEEPALSQQYGVRGIPAVLALKNGEIVAEFVGAQPAQVVSNWLNGLLPTESELSHQEAGRLIGEGHLDEAVAALERRLGQDESDHGAALCLARLLIDRGDVERAVALLRAIPQGAVESDDASGELALVELIHAGREDVAAGADGAEARFARAGRAWKEGRHEEAIDELLELLRSDRSFRDGLAKRALLAALGHLESGSEIVEDARRRLGMILFS